MKSNWEQFIKKEDTAETGKKQRGEEQATIRETLEQYRLDACQVGKHLSYQLTKNLAQQTDFPAMEEMEEQTGEKAIDLTSFLWNQLPEQAQKKLADSKEHFILFNSISADIEGLSKALEERKVDISLLPYVLAELRKHGVLDIEELTRTDTGSGQKQSLLDSAIAQATKTAFTKIPAPIPEHLYTPSSKQYRNTNTLIPKGKKIENGVTNGVAYTHELSYLPDEEQTKEEITKNIDVITKLLILFFSTRKETGETSITLKTTDIINTIGVDPRSLYLENNQRLSRQKARLLFITEIRKIFAHLYGRIQGDTNVYSVINFEKASLICDSVTFSSPFYDRILKNMEANIDTNKFNNMLTKQCLSSLYHYEIEVCIGITTLILSRGDKTKDAPKNEQHKVTAQITYQRFLEDYTPNLWAHLNSQTTANRNATLKRVFGKVLGTEKKKSILLNPVYCELTTKFQGVSLSTDIPTWSKLRDVKITITHRGKTKK